MGITEQNITDYMEAVGKTAGSNGSVWVVKMPSVINLAVFGPMATVFDMQYNILNVSQEGIMLIAVDNMGRLRPEHIWLEKEDVQSVSIKKGLINYDININTANGDIKYRLNKIMAGSSFHKKNVTNVVELLKAMA